MKNRQPLFHVVKRENASLGRQAAAYFAAVVLALAVGAVLLAVQGVEPLTFYRQMFTMGIPGSRYPWRAVENFIRLFVPLLIVSLALALAFKMRFWNIGGEGQFIMGAFWAAVAGMQLGESLPKPLMLLVMALCGALGGGLYGVFVAALKVKWGTNETLLTLMLNYIALYFLQFFAETKGEWNFFLDPESARPRFARFPDSAQMMTIPIGPFNLNLSLVVALVLCILIFIYLSYTKRGYEIAVVGDSPNTARYAGMRVGRIVIRTIFLSAALIGMAGAFHVSSAGVMSASPTNDVGWTGIVVAWLAKLNTAGIVVASLLITVLQYGCQTASTTYPAIDSNFASLLQGVILFIVLAADFFTRFRLAVRTGKEGTK
ncbi:MAG: ABC transporter permease [Lawsonibacter sp.]|nr:ABC transporter permease [Lawsonibacter sp.]